MNTVILMGRLTRDPDIRHGGVNNTCVARYSIAVDRRFKREGEPDADFFNIVSFGKQAEFIEQYIRKGTKVVVQGELRNNNYTNKDGQKVYSIEINANSVEFAESKSASQSNNSFGGGFDAPAPSGDGDGFINIENGIDDELPFV